MTRRPRRAGFGWIAGIVVFCSLAGLRGQTYVYLTEVPDYQWEYGCFGTATGNLMGFWDRHGLPDFYTGPTAGGVAPLRSEAPNGGIRSMWASQQGFDGRPADKPGHVDDYWDTTGGSQGWGYESTADDAYRRAGRAEHAPDCIGDFIGLNQKKWTNLNNECAGNINAYSFVFWDKRGVRRNNSYTTNGGVYIPDIGSGLREWARYRGYEADVFTQLTDFNAERATTNGFTFEDVKKEILAGYPVLCFLQPTAEFYRSFPPRTGPPPEPGMTNANPEIHGITIYGYAENVPELSIDKAVIVRTSWGSGDNVYEEWSLHTWLNLFYSSPFCPRGVIGFHPKPKVRRLIRGIGNVTLTWDGPSSQLYDHLAVTNSPPLQRYRVQRATTLSPADWANVGSLTTDRTATVPDAGTASAFYRVVLQP